MGLRKGYSAQYCLAFVLEKWRSVVDNKKSFGALLTELLSNWSFSRVNSRPLLFNIFLRDFL